MIKPNKTLTSIYTNDPNLIRNKLKILEIIEIMKLHKLS